MPDHGKFPGQEPVEGHGGLTFLEAPRFAPLPASSLLSRVRSNLDACLAPAPKSVPEWAWAFAPMFRSAYLRRPRPVRSLLASSLLHVGAIAWLVHAPALPGARNRTPALLADAVRTERTILWYPTPAPLPPVSPLNESPAEKKETKVLPPVLPPPKNAEKQEAQTLRAVQTIISRPPKPDNQRQTIVQPEVPRLRITTEVRLPNLVLWSRPVVPPPPVPAEAQRELAQIPVPRLPKPQVTVAPPPLPKLAEVRVTLSAIPLPALTVTEVPKLPVPEARLVKVASPEPPMLPAVLPETTPAVLPSLVAVSATPPPPPEEGKITVPEGNRAGSFATSSEGEGGNEDASLEGEKGGLSPQMASAGLGQRDLAEIRVPHLSISGGRVLNIPGPEMAPEVRAVSPPASSAPRAPGNLRELMAKATRPNLLPEASRRPSFEAEFFGDRRFYTVYINMPNLTSVSGSWVLRFGELDGAGNAQDGVGELAAPVAVRKVDPQYVPAAVRERVEGTVILAAHILRDGTVASIKVVRGLDPRLDASAALALSQWQFQPAKRNGIPVSLEVLVQVPFRLPAF